MLANRLQRIYRHLRKWARRTDVACFRIYEKDIPDQPLIVDWYDGRALVYAMNRKKDETEAQRWAWLADVEMEVREALDLPEPADEADDRLFFKERRRKKAGEQYQKLAEERREFVVPEQGQRFIVNLSDYHDTGLFLDHRNTRRLVREEAEGKRFLNLFAYTGTFTVYAAAGGAASTTTVDISNTYLEWAARNFELNGLNEGTNRIERADVLQWLPQAAREGRKWDLIVLDPPTFSNSKKMRDFLDVGRQHPELINGCLRLLPPGGALYFSTNYRGFELNESALAPCEPVEITKLTVPEDYRNKKIHRCWRITRHEGGGMSEKNEGGGRRTKG
jgi:23S rRNA (cytosine1962-C5)-methyltransferase